MTFFVNYIDSVNYLFIQSIINRPHLLAQLDRVARSIDRIDLQSYVISFEISDLKNQILLLQFK